LNIFEAGCAILLAMLACAGGACLLRPWRDVVGPWLDVVGPASVVVVALGLLALLAQDWWVRRRLARKDREDG
jgi:hypothetical protein